MRVKPVGASTSGIGSGRPSSVVDGSGLPDALQDARVEPDAAERRASSRAIVRSSSAPPSM